MELGIDSLLRARERDPYLDPAKRLLYERVRGEAAPTFEAVELDAAVARTRLVRDGKTRRQSASGHGKGGSFSPVEVAVAASVGPGNG